MKFCKFLCKLIIVLLAICGACYIFVEIINKLDRNDEDDFEDELLEGKGFIQKVKEAASRDWARLK